MSFSKYLALVLFGLFLTATLSGCYSSTAFVRLEDRNLETIAQAKDGTKKMLATWEFRSGLIHGALEPRLAELPAQAVKALDELDRLAARRDELSDYDLGYALGLRLRMLESTVRQVVKKFAPNVLAYLPF